MWFFFPPFNIFLFIPITTKRHTHLHTYINTYSHTHIPLLLVPNEGRSERPHRHQHGGETGDGCPHLFFSVCVYVCVAAPIYTRTGSLDVDDGGSRCKRKRRGGGQEGDNRERCNSCGCVCVCVWVLIRWIYIIEREMVKTCTHTHIHTTPQSQRARTNGGNIHEATVSVSVCVCVGRTLWFRMYLSQLKQGGRRNENIISRVLLEWGDEQWGNV